MCGEVGLGRHGRNEVRPAALCFNGYGDYGEEARLAISGGGCGESLVAWLMCSFSCVGSC